MLNTDFLKTLVVVFSITIIYTQCASFQSNPSTSDTISSSSSNRTTNEQRLRREVVQYAKKHIGIGYQPAGRSSRGFDCSGFTHYVLRKFDIHLPTISAAQEQKGAAVEVTQVEPGDLVFFRRQQKGRVFHVGLVVENTPSGIEVIHSTSSRGIVVDNISDSRFWSTKVLTARNVLAPICCPAR